MDANELKEWNKIRSRELKEKFLKSQNIIETHRNYMNMRDYLNNLNEQIEEKKLLLGDSND